MWTPIALPGIRGRIWAFSIPAANEMMVGSGDSLYLLRLAPTVRRNKVCSGAEVRGMFDVRRDGIVYQDRVYHIHGECGPGGESCGDITRCDLPDGEHLEVDPDRERLLILDSANRMVQSIDDFAVNSQDWAVAGFSDDGCYLAVGHPGRLRVFGRGS